MGISGLKIRPHLYRERVFEMNASDDRGIKAVREKVKKFAMNAISKNVDKYFNPHTGTICAQTSRLSSWMKQIQ
jgi:hypothetical protein